MTFPVDTKLGQDAIELMVKAAVQAERNRTARRLIDYADFLRFRGRDDAADAAVEFAKDLLRNPQGSGQESSSVLTTPAEKTTCNRCDGMGEVHEVKDGDLVRAEPAYPHVPRYKRLTCAACGGKGVLTTPAPPAEEIKKHLDEYRNAVVAYLHRAMGKFLRLGLSREMIAYLVLQAAAKDIEGNLIRDPSDK